LSGKTGQTLTLHSYGTNKQGGHITTIRWRSHWRRRRYLEINSSRDDIILSLIVGYVCYSTITGGSSQHSVVVFDLHVAASECSHLDAV